MDGADTIIAINDLYSDIFASTQDYPGTMVAYLAGSAILGFYTLVVSRVSYDDAPSHGGRIHPAGQAIPQKTAQESREVGKASRKPG